MQRHDGAPPIGSRRSCRRGIVFPRWGSAWIHALDLHHADASTSSCRAWTPSPIGMKTLPHRGKPAHALASRRRATGCTSSCHSMKVFPHLRDVDSPTACCLCSDRMALQTHATAWVHRTDRGRPRADERQPTRATSMASLASRAAWSDMLHLKRWHQAALPRSSNASRVARRARYGCAVVRPAVSDEVDVPRVRHRVDLVGERGGRPEVPRWRAGKGRRVDRR